MRNGSRVITPRGRTAVQQLSCDQLFTWPTDQPRHATEHFRYPVDTRSPPDGLPTVRAAIGIIRFAHDGKKLHPLAGRIRRRDVVAGDSPGDVRHARSCSPPSSHAVAAHLPTVPLWDGKAPHAVGDSDADKPSLTVFRAEKANGAAVVVCPGGGYGFLADDHEGKQVAEFLNTLGVTAFVLKYRIVTKDRPGPLAPGAARRTPSGRSGSCGEGEGLRHRPEARRHLGLLGRRAPRQHRRHALRRRRRRTATPIDKAELPAGLRDPRLPGHHDGGRRDARRVAEQPARRRSRTRSWSSCTRTRSR